MRVSTCTSLLCIAVGVSRPTSNTSSQPTSVGVHTSHDQNRTSGDKSRGSHDARTSAASGSKRSQHSQQVHVHVYIRTHYTCIYIVYMKK